MQTLNQREQLRKDASARDNDRLQGDWHFVAGQREAQLHVAGERYTIRFRNGDVYVGTFALDPIHRPRAMDLHIHDGPEQFRGKTALAIYEFDGDHLIWCPAEPGRDERLGSFPPADDSGTLCIIFRRDRRPN